MTEKNKAKTKKGFSLDWLVGGVLTKIGDTFDRLTGRGWNPSSSLATSKLIEKLKFLLDSEVRDLGKEGKFVPHIIKLKIQWDKFSTDSENDLEMLEHELHAAAIDHINDRLYHTYAPMEIDIDTDYFTDGIRMLASFGSFSEKENDEVAINVTIPNLRTEDLITDNKITVNLTQDQIKSLDDCFIVKFTAKGKPKEIEINFTENKRISVGRSKENHIFIDDGSVSKIHAAIVLNDEKQLMVADTGSTNGTFIDGNRIAYGKAFVFNDDSKVRFGTVEVMFERLEQVFEEIVDEESLEIEDPQIMPTQAAINPIEKEVIPEIKPTEASINNINDEIPQPEAVVNAEKSEVQPTQASVKVKDQQQKNIKKSEDLDFDVEEFSLPEESDSDEESVEINIDKTQDWEI